MENVTNLDNEKWMKEIWDWADEAHIDEEIIPRQAKKLIQLKELDLSNNSEIKNIPESIGNLENLKVFILKGSKVKKLPDSISKLSRLIALDIDDNFSLIEISESIGSLKSLESLSLRNGNIKRLPDSIGQLSSLKTLNIECNYIIGGDINIIPKSIGQLSKLTTLNIKNNQNLTSIPSDIGSLKKLKSLDLSENELLMLPESIGDLLNLVTLNIELNKITKLPESIGQLSNLTILNIKNNEISALPESVGNLNKVKTFYLGNNKFENLPESLTNLIALEEFSLKDNPLNKLSSTLIKFLQSLDYYVYGLDELNSSISNVSNENDTSTFLQVNGYGVETFAGTVEAATYQYFEDNDIDLEGYSNDVQWGDGDCQVPEEHNFGGGGLYEVDNLWHVSGAYLTEDNQIELMNSSEDILWSSNCDIKSLESQGIKLICVSSQEDVFDSLDLKTVVMIGRSFQQGCTFETQLEDIEDFDPNNLTIYYHEDESGSIIKKIKYNDTELENGNSSTSGSGSEYSWEVIG
ncbi:leucine-rich repeat domain-containing protein [Psychrobacter glacincola]|uniref:leucine-rich repeat domain-containing protein n=1 Tax=Psychrobacter glacincola TaxID=56810 RepID=UPI0039B09E90